MTRAELAALAELAAPHPLARSKLNDPMTPGLLPARPAAPRCAVDRAAPPGLAWPDT
jgi:hypothetical protein